MSITSRLAWVVKGSQHTEIALQGLGNDLRDLQHKVQTLADVVAALQAEVAVGSNRADIERLETSVGAIRHQMRVVADDLGDRVGAVAELLNSRA